MEITKENQALIFTEDAASKVRALIDEEGNPDLKLRIFVSGGGCSGFQYEIKLEKKINPDDSVVQKNKLKVVIDPTSLEFLGGATIDYSEELIGAKFIVNNPNASSSCGCGISFSI